MENETKTPAAEAVQEPAATEAAAPVAAPAAAPAAQAAPQAAASGSAPQQSGERRQYDRPQQRGGPRPRRRKVCQFCVDRIDYIDYKDVGRLNKFVSERGKIVPRRVTGTCAQHQRELTSAIKRSRQVALMPYVSD